MFVPLSHDLTLFVLLLLRWPHIYPDCTYEISSLPTTKQSKKIDFRCLFNTVQNLTATSVSSFVGDQRKDGTYEVPVMQKFISTGVQELLNTRVAFYVVTYWSHSLKTVRKVVVEMI